MQELLSFQNIFLVFLNVFVSSYHFCQYFFQFFWGWDLKKDIIQDKQFKVTFNIFDIVKFFYKF